ncbi:MAG: MFS transporter [Acidobacteriia bacterium]|nr:MFS transporter [Terriglobia bacterium]
MRDPDVAALVRNIMIEVEAVANKQGLELPVSIDQRIAGAGKVGEHKTSMLQVLEAGRSMKLDMLRTQHFYVLFSMALMNGHRGADGDRAGASPMTDTLKIGAAALMLSLTLNPLGNGGARIFWGWVTDHMGQRTMATAFSLQSVFLMGAFTLGRLFTPFFVATLPLVVLTWGEVYSLFLSACVDWFGARNVSSNYGFFFSAKGVASILAGGAAAKLYEINGSWNYWFYVWAVLALMNAGMALGIRKMWLPKKQVAKPQQPAAATYVS